MSTKTQRFESYGVAGYKQLIAHGSTAQDGVNEFGIDAGINGNILGDSYFKFNADFLAGKLHRMLIGPQIQEKKTNTLVIRPVSAKKLLKGDKSEF